MEVRRAHVPRLPRGLGLTLRRRARDPRPHGATAVAVAVAAATTTSTSAVISRRRARRRGDRRFKNVKIEWGRGGTGGRGAPQPVGAKRPSRPTA
jgi:hypothetical protein